ncbi:MAG: hypothetical protein AAGK66_07255 [Pseudomonadota bacterium]
MRNYLEIVSLLHSEIGKYDQNYLRLHTWKTPEGIFSSDQIKEASIKTWLIDISGFDLSDPTIFNGVPKNDAETWFCLFVSHCMIHNTWQLITKELELLISEAVLALGPNAMFFAIGEWQYTRRDKHYEIARSNGPWTNRRRYSLRLAGTCFSADNQTMQAGIALVGKRNTLCLWSENED